LYIFSKHNSIRLRKIDKALQKHFHCPSGATDDTASVRSVSSGSEAEGAEDEEGEENGADGKESGSSKDQSSSSDDDDASTLSDVRIGEKYSK